MRKRETYPIACRIAASATIVIFALSGMAIGQTPAPAPQAPAAGAPASPTQKTFSQEELDQLVAPIALFPDPLVAQVLMASTYPLEIVSAERWQKANAKLKDKALEDALQQQTWDPAVKSLVVVPQVLTMMSEKLDWTQKLGDAFLAQEKDVMDTVQALRSKAAAQGNLKDSKEQKVITEQTATTTIIKIEPSNPEVVYVPTYNPAVVYGAWPYPAYPPYYYYPPGYVAGAALIGFTAGAIIGGALWGNCNWGGGNVNVNVNRYNNFNRTNVSNGNWQHNSNHRGAVPYKDKGVAQKYDRGGSPGASQRDAYRGRDAGGQGPSRGDAGRGSAGSFDNRGPSAGSLDNRGGGGGGSFDNRGGGGADRTSGSAGGAGRDYGNRNSSAFDTGSRAQTREASSRGSSSMSGSRGGGGGGMSSGGGGARGGGGGGGGRGGGGGGRGGGGRR